MRPRSTGEGGTPTWAAPNPALAPLPRLKEPHRHVPRCGQQYLILHSPTIPSWEPPHQSCSVRHNFYQTLSTSLTSRQLPIEVLIGLQVLRTGNPRRTTSAHGGPLSGTLPSHIARQLSYNGTWQTFLRAAVDSYQTNCQRIPPYPYSTST